MSAELALDLFRQALMVALLLALPPLLASWATAWLMGALQVFAGIPDASLGFVPRLIVVLAAWVAVLPWMMTELSAFSVLLFELGLRPELAY